MEIDEWSRGGIIITLTNGESGARDRAKQITFAVHQNFTFLNYSNPMNFFYL